MKFCPTCNRQYEGDDFVRCPYDGSNLVDADAAGTDPLIGALFGESYQIVRVIGEGGMGRVYEARHVRLTKRYAIKVLHPQFNTNPETIARFRREAEAATSIGQENILDVIDFNETAEGVYYIVTEYLEGRSLARAMAEDGLMKTARCLTIQHQVARALAAAHRGTIVHRDLKPENIFLVRRFETDDFVKVLDFGISKMRSGGDRLTQTGQIIGTPHYMSPEQAQGELNLDHRSDVYSFGAIMYEMFTGRLPYLADSVQQILVKLLTEPPPPPRTQRPDLPLDIEAVILRCMAREPAERFQTMDELDQALLGLWSVHVGADAPSPMQSIGLSSAPDLNLNGGVGTLPTLGPAATAPTGYPTGPGTPAPGAYTGPGVGAPAPAGVTGPQGPITGGWGATGRATPSPVGQHITANSVPKKGRPVALIVVLLLLVLGGGGGALWFFVLREGAPKGGSGKTAEPGPGMEPGGEGPRRRGAAPATRPPVRRVAPRPDPYRGMILVKGGTFDQGRAKGHKYESPQVKGVKVGDYYLDAAEVSRGEYAAYLGGAGKAVRSPFKGGREAPQGTAALPVTDVTWQEATGYCKSLGKRLPTEQEWEYIARGKTHDQLHPWGDAFDPTKAVSSVAKPGALQPVRSGPTVEGFYHLVGNAWEWTSSQFKPYPGSKVKGVYGTQYVIRGGGADSKKTEELTATFRYFNYGHLNPRTKKIASYKVLGFRCARDVGATP